MVEEKKIKTDSPAGEKKAEAKKASVKKVSVKKPVASGTKKKVDSDGAEKVVSEVKKKTEAKKTSGVYFEGVGRRKTSVARVRIFSISKGDSEIVVNDKEMNVYFPTKEMQVLVESPLNKMKVADKFKVTVKVKGGGVHAQSEAVRHGISRALIKFNAEFRKRLKKAGYLTRDQRAVERKKPGKVKARKAKQWSKR